MKNIKLAVLALLSSLVVSGLVLPDADAETDINITEKARIVDALLEDLNTPGSPGAAVAVVYDGSLVYSNGFGLANLEYNIPNTPQTIYHVASVSKQFTVYAVLLLEQMGKLSIDDDIRIFIPELPDFGDVITLRHLASHTSGLRDQWNLLGMAGWRLDDVITKEHILTYTSRQKELNFPPGEQYLYSNTGFTLLGEVVARVSGMTFNEFAIQQIFKPLGMTNTFFYDDHERIVSNRAYSYYSNEDLFKKSILSYANAGATSLFTTAEDLGRWAIFMNRPYADKVPVVELMNRQAKLTSGETIRGALGQFVDNYRGLHRIQHGGADAGYRTFMARFPEQNFAVIVLGNYAQFNPAMYASLITAVYLEDLLESDEPLPLFSFVENPGIDIDFLKKFEGLYVNQINATSRNISVKNNDLTFSSGGHHANLIHVSDSLFWFPGTEITILFKDQYGKMTASVNTPQEPIHYIRENPVSYSKEDLETFTGNYFSEELQTTYSIELNEGNLVARHLRTGDISLVPASENHFRGDRWYMQGVRFIKENGEVTGFRASSSRVWNVWFERIQ